MHLLDDAVTQVLHQIFDRMSVVPDNMIVGSAQDHQMAELRSEIKRMKAESTKANTEYESLKSEIIKVVQGKSKMPVDVLSELVNESRDKVLATSERLTVLMAELERGNEKAAEMKNELSRIRTWSEIFDESNMEVKKMITSYIIKRVNVFKDYKLDIELNLDIQQFLNGIDSITVSAT